MNQKALTADAIFDGKTLHTAKTILLSDEGTFKETMNEVLPDAIKYEGILCPGFINSHCHLELSAMKGGAEKTGLVNFLINVVQGRHKKSEDVPTAIAVAHDEMWHNGIDAVVDICNTADTVAIKKSSPLLWQNMVEVISLYDDTLAKQQAYYTGVQRQFLAAGLHAQLTPHAPYTVTPAALQWLNESTAGGLVTMHNSEAAAENELFATGSGDFLKLYQTVGRGTAVIGGTGRSSLQSWLPYFTEGQTIILVHNSFVSEADILFAKEHASLYGLQLFWCLCPNANLFIEDVLPPLVLLMKHHCKIIVGTDSYSSNHQLSIVAELNTLQQNFPQLDVTTLLQWATGNAAPLFNNKKGLFTAGLQPGVVLVQTNNNTLTAQRII